MSKTRLLLVTTVLVFGLIGVVYAGPTATINVTATVGVSASLSPSTTSYAFGTDLLYGTTYHGSAGVTVGDRTPVIFTNDGSVTETLKVKWNAGSSWTYDDTGATLINAPTGDNNAKIGGNWGDTSLEVKAMTGLQSTDGLQSPTVSTLGTLKLWLGIWTPASIDSSAKASGAVSLTVTATAQP